MHGRSGSVLFHMILKVWNLARVETINKFIYFYATMPLNGNTLPFYMNLPHETTGVNLITVGRYHSSHILVRMFNIIAHSTGTYIGMCASCMNTKKGKKNSIRYWLAAIWIDGGLWNDLHVLYTVIFIERTSMPGHSRPRMKFSEYVVSL